LNLRHTPHERRLQRKIDAGQADDRKNQGDDRRVIALAPLRPNHAQRDDGGCDAPESNENPQQ
jgi:hypothetical protein